MFGQADYVVSFIVIVVRPAGSVLTRGGGESNCGREAGLCGLCEAGAVPESSGLYLIDSRKKDR